MDEELIPGTADPEPSADPLLDAGTGSPADGATAPTEGADDAFFDPAQVPEALKPHWKKMQGTFTKKMQGIRAQRQDVDLVSRYRSDPAFARTFIVQEAARLGISVGDGATPASPAGAPAPAPAPPALVEAARRNLPPELQWMAPALAAVYGEAHRQTVEPELRQRREEQARSRQEQWDDLAATLGETAPGWEAHEDEMAELLTFMQSDVMHSRRWGSKLDLLYRLASGSQAATTEAARRMGASLRQRVVSGTPGRQATPNVTERIVGAKSNDEAWQIAARHAVESMRSSGGGTA